MSLTPEERAANARADLRTAGNNMEELQAGIDRALLLWPSLSNEEKEIYAAKLLTLTRLTEDWRVNEQAAQKRFRRATQPK